jgi:hypothetical protein
MPKLCYWCGAPATSREHVPSAALFPLGKNTNLITVPSCANHNEAMTLLDEKFRFFLQARETNADALNAFKDKTFRGLSKPEAKGLVTGLAAGSHRVVVNGAQTIALQVNPTEQNLYFEKIIRGLYFHVFKRPAAGRVVSASKDFIVPGFDYAELYAIIGPYLNDPNVTREGKTSNPDIFRFKYARVEDGGKEAVAMALLFYGGVEVIGFITPEETPPGGNPST